jgi:hypothetical protein
MKLKNKKTGEIVDFKIHKYAELSDDGNPVYEPFKGNIEEWEDYEDELYYIISAEHKDGYLCALKEDYKELCDTAKELGIGFETEKEAEKAVEKLKAFKRLKDKGFRFKKWDYEGNKMVIQFYFEKQSWATETEPDLNLLFSGGEE